MNSKRNMIKWVSNRTSGYENVNVKNLSTSFKNGLAFCALVHSYSKTFDFNSLSPDNPEENLQLAFDVAEENLGIPKLLEVADITDDTVPDSDIIFTYLSQFARKNPKKGNIRKNTAKEKVYNNDHDEIMGMFSKDFIQEEIEKKKKERLLKKLDGKNKLSPNVNQKKGASGVGGVSRGRFQKKKDGNTKLLISEEKFEEKKTEAVEKGFDESEDWIEKEAKESMVKVVEESEDHCCIIL